MNSDLENKLARQPIRKLPPEWRAEILQAATAQLPSQQESRMAMAYRQLSSLLWPRPIAGTGLAAVWVAIFFLNAASRDEAPGVAALPAPAPSWIATSRNQQWLIGDWGMATDSTRIQPSEKPKPSPRSYWNRRKTFALV